MGTRSWGIEKKPVRFSLPYLLDCWWREFRWRVRGYIPFTHWWLVERKLDKSARNVLDLGCGIGKPMRFFNRRRRFLTVGVDKFKPYIERCRRERSHTKLVLGDIRRLGFKDKTFDVVICLQTLEHLTLRDGRRLVRDMERIARKQVIITTDIGEYVYSGADDNPLQKHRYVWSAGELKEAGFKVYGIGLRGWGGETGLSRFLPFPLQWFFGTAMQIGLGGIMYFKPEWAGAAICVKEL